MNTMLALGVICRSAGRGRWVPAAIGAVIAVLLAFSNALYIRHPELLDAEFPIIRLLSSFGRDGFIAGAVLLYAAIFTTLVAVISALRSVVERHIIKSLFSVVVTLGLPLLASCVGFGSMVEQVYAPAGLVCLLAVFLPLALRKRKQDLTFQD